MKREFAWVAAFREAGLPLPSRRTRHSAGYDLAAAEDCTLPPGEVTIVPTGLKAYMPSGEFLQVTIRSGLSARRGLSLINGAAIIDADYADNPDNEGHILLAVFNHSREPVAVARGERIAQGIFLRYATVDSEAQVAGGAARRGGFGSTGT